MQLSTPNELIATLRSEVARYRRLIEHAEGYIAALEGSAPSNIHSVKSVNAAPVASQPIRRAPLVTSRQLGAGVNKSAHSVIMPGSHSAMCQEALQQAGKPLHVDDLFNFCKSHGAAVKQASYLQSALYRHKHAFVYKGGGMWDLQRANKPAGDQFSLNGNGH